MEFKEFEQETLDSFITQSYNDRLGKLWGVRENTNINPVSQLWLSNKKYGEVNPKEPHKLPYYYPSDNQNGQYKFTPDFLMFTDGLVVDNADDLNVCKQNADTPLSDVINWYSFGDSASKNSWFEYDTTTDTSMPGFTYNGKPQDYIYNTTNPDCFTGFISPVEYTNYDVILSMGIVNNKKSVGATDYIAYIPCVCIENTTFWGISISAHTMYDNDNWNRSRQSTQHHTVSVQAWKQTGEIATPHNNNVGVSLLSTEDGNKIIEFNQDYNNNVGTHESSSMLIRVIRNKHIITAYFSDPYYTSEDDYTHLNDIYYDRPVIIDLKNYTLTFKDKDGNTTVNNFSANNTVVEIFDKVVSSAKKGYEQSSNPGSIFKLAYSDELILDISDGENKVLGFDGNRWGWKFNENSLSKPYIEINGIKYYQDGQTNSGSARYKWTNTNETPSTYYTYVEVPDVSLNDVAYNTNIPQQNSTSYQITSVGGMHLLPTDLFTGSHIAFNKITKKLFYSDGVVITYIANIGGTGTVNNFGQNIYIDGDGNITALPMIYITYDELVRLRDGSKLIPGEQYRIIDYVTKVTTGDTESRSAEHPFDVICFADDNHTINENVRFAKCIDPSNASFGGFIRTSERDVNTYDWVLGMQLEGTLLEDTIENISENPKYYAWYNSSLDIYAYTITLTPSSSDDVFLALTSGGTITTMIDSTFYELKTLTEYNATSSSQISFGSYTSSNDYWSTCKLESWEGKYCLDNDGNRFAWADANTGKGVIYWLKDEYNNEAYYDFKNIQFKRWAITDITSTVMTSSDMTDGLNCLLYSSTQPIRFCYKDSDLTYTNAAFGITSTSYEYYFTFTLIDSDGTVTDASITMQNTPSSQAHSILGIRNNIIKEYYDNLSSIMKLCLNNNVIVSTTGVGSVNNLFEVNCHHNTLSDFCCYNIFGSEFSGNIFSFKVVDNVFKNSCKDNIMGCKVTLTDGFNNNTIGYGFDSNIINANFEKNTVGCNAAYNVIRNKFQKNFIGEGLNANIFNTFTDNTVRNWMYNNELNTDISSSTFGDNLRDIKISKPNDKYRSINVFDYIQYVSDLTQDDFGHTLAANVNYQQNIGKTTAGKLLIVNPMDLLTFAVNS